MGGRSRGGSEQRSPYSPQFITALHEFGDRARASLGVEAATGGGGSNLDDGGRKGEKTTAGSAAAEAGGWLLNRLAYVLLLCFCSCVCFCFLWLEGFFGGVSVVISVLVCVL